MLTFAILLSLPVYRRCLASLLESFFILNENYYKNALLLPQYPLWLVKQNRAIFYHNQSAAKPIATWSITIPRQTYFPFPPQTRASVIGHF